MPPTFASEFQCSLCDRPRRSSSWTGLLHDDAPSYGINLFDDRIAISGCDPDSGSIKMLIDTDASEAREWAESVYASYKSDARPLESTPIVE